MFQIQGSPSRPPYYLGFAISFMALQINYPQHAFIHFNLEDKKSNCCLTKLFQVAIWFVSRESEPLRVSCLPSLESLAQVSVSIGYETYFTATVFQVLAMPLLHGKPEDEASPGLPLHVVQLSPLLF